MNTYTIPLPELDMDMEVRAMSIRDFATLLGPLPDDPQEASICLIDRVSQFASTILVGPPELLDMPVEDLSPTTPLMIAYNAYWKGYSKKALKSST